MGDLLPTSAFNDLKLTDSSQPMLLEGETVLNMQGGVALYNNDNKTPYPEGTARVTSHRILFTGPQHTALYLPLSDIRTVDFVKKFLRQSPKVILHLNPPFDGYLKLSFRNGGHDEAYEQIRLALVKKAWLAQASARGHSLNSGSAGSARSSGAVSPASRRGVGIAGIQQRREEERKEVDGDLAETFKSLQSLSIKASGMVDLAQKLQVKLAKKAPCDDDNMKFKSYMLSLGIAQPVTKSSSSGELKYFEDLAKELCDFLKKPLKDSGGTLPLTSVYCLYNRARGSELIAPNDLLRACGTLKPQRLPLVMRTFPSGVIVIQLETESDEGVVETLRKIFYDTPALKVDKKWVVMSPADYAKHRGIAIPLAQEQLLTGERSGLLCRDDTIAGLKFYPNLIVAGN